MSVMDKLINAMKINPEEEYYDDESFEDLDQQESTPAPSLFKRKTEDRSFTEEERGERRMAEKSSYSSFRSNRRSGGNGNSRG